jgi:hypothetical protein
MADTQHPDQQQPASKGRGVLWGWLGFFGLVVVVVALTFVYGGDQKGPGNAEDKPAATTGTTTQ